MSQIKLPIQVGQKFLSNGKPGAIISTTIEDGPYTVAWLADDGSLVSYFTADGGCLAGFREHRCDLQPIPVVITEGVEFSGPEYREEFERLESEGRKFEIFLGGAFRSFRSGAGFCDDDVYCLLPVPQHTDASENVLKVGDRVRVDGVDGTITEFDGDLASTDRMTFGLKSCRKLTTRNRPLCADDLDQAPCPMFLRHGERYSPNWSDSLVRIGVHAFGYDSLEEFRWRPSADKPWRPCEVTEEVLA